MVDAVPNGPKLPSVDQDEYEDLDHAIVVRQLRDTTANPNLRFRDTVQIRDTSRSAIYAEHAEIVDPQTGELHHHTVNLSRLNKRGLKVGKAFVATSLDKIRIEDRNNDEIGLLRDFLSVIRTDIPEEPGKYLVLPLNGPDDDQGSVHAILSRLSTGGRASLLREVLESVDKNPDLLMQLAEYASVNPEASKIAAATLNLARYTEAIGRLRMMIGNNASEHDFQSLLDENPWMFGSEYSEKLDRRTWIRDQQTDFMMRRTVDSYLEIIEIKRPFNNESLFQWDRSHASWYPQSKLSQVLGQTIGYIDQLDAKRNDIFYDDGERVNKIRAKIVIGRNNDQDQIDALRKLNSHLHRIEITTYDQLLFTAERVLDHLRDVLSPVADTEDVPF